MSGYYPEGVGRGPWDPPLCDDCETYHEPLDPCPKEPDEDWSRDR